MAHSFEAVSVGEPSWAGLAGDIKAFAELHGGAKAVIEYLGKRGVRIALIGSDGAAGEMAAPGTDVACVACERAGVSVDNGWNRELAELTRPEKDLWRSMHRRTMPR